MEKTPDAETWKFRRQIESIGNHDQSSDNRAAWSESSDLGLGGQACYLATHTVPGEVLWQDSAPHAAWTGVPRPNRTFWAQLCSTSSVRH